MPPLLMAGLAVLLIASGQILFKMTADRIAGQAFSAILNDWRTIAIFGTSMGIYGIATIVWVLALRDLTLAHAYTLVSLSFVIVPIAAMVLFGEKLSSQFFLGLGLIIAGIVITLGARP